VRRASLRCLALSEFASREGLPALPLVVVVAKTTTRHTITTRSTRQQVPWHRVLMRVRCSSCCHSHNRSCSVGLSLKGIKDDNSWVVSGTKSGLGLCHLRAAMTRSFSMARSTARHGIFWVVPSMTRIRGPCRAYNLGMAGYMARPAFWIVFGPARK
jgi:hypothetical protein